MRSIFNSLNIRQEFKKFYLSYPFLPIDTLIDYFSIFGGLEDYNILNLHGNSLKEALLEYINNNDLKLPFFATQDPFRKFLIQIARGDGKIESSLNKVSIGQSFGSEIIEELIKTDILYTVNSREKPIKKYYKQAIKKEFRAYQIQNKLIFTKPIYKFWFAFVEPLKDRHSRINIEKLYNNLKKYQNKLTYLVFEQLSCELLKIYYKNGFNNCNSYWDIHSEFDIYTRTKDDKIIVGECKYTNRPITKAELLKLERKIEQSNLRADTIALFSKSGFSMELNKSKSDKLLLFKLEDFKALLDTF